MVISLPAVVTCKSFLSLPPNMARAQSGNSHKRKQQRCKILQYSRIFNHYTTATNTTNASSVIEEATERVDELDQDLKLIRTIKQFKILYSTDKLHKQYKPNILNQKDKAWTIVANAIGMSVNNVRSRWKSLRDNFRISIKRTRKCNNEGLTRLKSWKYHEEMEFLLPFMQINGVTIEKMFNIDRSAKESSNNSDDFKDDSSRSQNDVMNDDTEKPKTKVENVDVNEMLSSSSTDSAVEDEFLFADVKIPHHDEHEPDYEVCTCVKHSDEPVTTAVTATNVVVSSAQLEHDQPHMINRPYTQYKQNHCETDPIDLFFYSMSETTKTLPREIQATIQRNVLDIVLYFQEKAYKNKKLRGN